MTVLAWSLNHVHDVLNFFLDDLNLTYIEYCQVVYWNQCVRYTWISRLPFFFGSKFSIIKEWCHRQNFIDEQNNFYYCHLGEALIWLLLNAILSFNSCSIVVIEIIACGSHYCIIRCSFPLHLCIGICVYVLCLGGWFYLGKKWSWCVLYL